MDRTKRQEREKRKEKLGSEFTEGEGKEKIEEKRDRERKDAVIIATTNICISNTK